MKPPKHVLVGPHVYSVHTSQKRWEELEDQEANGQMCNRTLNIWLRPGMAPTVQREVLVHELMHAIWLTSGSAADLVTWLNVEPDEVAARTLSTLWLQVLRDNKALVDWLRLVE